MKPNNGDLPAMPTIYADMATNGQREIYCDQTGLTKREQFAMAAMQGLLSGNPLPELNEMSKNNGLYSAEEIVFQLSVKFADGVLAELERTK